MNGDQSPIEFHAASSDDPDRAGHLRITVEVAPGKGEEATRLAGFVRSGDVPAALRGLDRMWKGAVVGKVADATFYALSDEAAFATLSENGTAHMILAGALWVACRNGNMGIDVERGVREALQQEGHAHLQVSCVPNGKARSAQLRARLLPVTLPH